MLDMKDNIYKKLQDYGIIPVIKIEDENKAVPLAEALIKGGLNAAEITFRTKCAGAAIRKISEALPDMLVAAGTVLTGEQAQEAVDCGAKIIISKAASLPEIYGNTAHYIDPFNTDIDLEKLLEEPVEKPDDILQKYSYDTAAQQVYELIREHI